MNLESAIYLGIAGLVMTAAAFFLGRRTSAGVARQLELEAELTTAHSEQARAEAEAERLRNELDAGRKEYDEYRLNVVDHFSGTSDLLRDLTVQYRSVYEHLTQGASTLCPEGFVGLTEGLPLPQLAEPQADLEVEPADERLSDDADRAADAQVAAPASFDPDAASDPDAAVRAEETSETDREQADRSDDSEDTLTVPAVSA